MKNLYLFVALLFISTVALGQTSDEVKSYFNRTNIAIYKCQKELLRAPDPNLDAEFKDLLLYQLNAKTYYTQNDFKQSLKFSAECRNKCVSLFSKLKLPEDKFYQNTPEEKKALKNVDSSPLPNTNQALSNDQLKQVVLLDTKSPQAVYSLIPNIN